MSFFIIPLFPFITTRIPKLDYRFIIIHTINDPISHRNLIITRCEIASDVGTGSQLSSSIGIRVYMIRVGIIRRIHIMNDQSEYAVYISINRLTRVIVGAFG